jgi:hypothetical protein
MMPPGELAASLEPEPSSWDEMEMIRPNYFPLRGKTRQALRSAPDFPMEPAGTSRGADLSTDACRKAGVHIALASWQVDHGDEKTLGCLQTC